MAEAKIPVGISARHVHVTREHLSILFGAGHELTPVKMLSQPGEFASEEMVDTVTEKGSFQHVRILGPVRKHTQIELAASDTFRLGVRPPVRDSGNTAGTPGVKLVGPAGTVTLSEGVMIAWRHIHMTPADAARYGVKDKEYVSVKTAGERAITYHNVLIRVKENFFLEFHVDTDEGNAAGLKNGDYVEIVR